MISCELIEENMNCFFCKKQLYIFPRVLIKGHLLFPGSCVKCLVRHIVKSINNKEKFRDNCFSCGDSNGTNILGYRFLCKKCYLDSLNEVIGHIENL